MKVFLNSRKGEYSAQAEYNPSTKETIVLKGSTVSADVHRSATFRGSVSILKSRAGKIKNGVLTENVSFKSPSTAANFVTGSSTNGRRVWKNEKGLCIAELEKV